MGNFIVDILNWLIKALGTVLGWVVSLLPNSPFSLIDNSSVNEYLGGLAWVIPFTQIIAILELWTTAIIIYYLYMAILRYVKVIA